LADFAWSVFVPSGAPSAGLFLIAPAERPPWGFFNSDPRCRCFGAPAQLNPARSGGLIVTTSDQDKQRISKEEETWNAPKLFVLGFVFLGACIALIILMANL
jgi:hypothetical protein